jgi:hypothetical protein
MCGALLRVSTRPNAWGSAVRRVSDTRIPRRLCTWLWRADTLPLTSDSNTTPQTGKSPIHAFELIVLGFSRQVSRPVDSVDRPGFAITFDVDRDLRGCAPFFCVLPPGAYSLRFFFSLASLSFSPCCRINRMTLKWSPSLLAVHNREIS